jgi:putative spermidine/putrescine transport system ATP-binding protein
METLPTPASTASSAKPMVKLANIAKHYGAVTALDTLDLEVRSGEFVALLGPSGSGKTTMLNIIAGMTAPSKGRVFIGDRDVTPVPPSKRNLGMVFQNYALLPHLSVFENVAFPLRVRRLPEREIKAKVEAVLDLVQLGYAVARQPRELSGGQQQRVSLARCIVYDPALILMDEPLGALDKKLREQMQIEIKRLHVQLGTTILYVTHDQEEALSMADRIVLFNHGRIVQQATPEELYFKPRSVFAATFLGASNILTATVSQAGAASLSRGDALSFTGAGVSAGTVQLLVRPESIRIGNDESGGDQGRQNVLDGTLVSSAILGNVTNHHVRLRGGEMLMAQELTRRGGVSREPGAKVTLQWSADDTRALEPDDHVGLDGAS